MIYLISFLLSILFAYFAKRSKNRTAFVFFSILSIAVTVLLAGLRHVSIGIDTSNYYSNSWAKAVNFRNLSLLEYLQVYVLGSRERFELLYAVLMGVVVRIAPNFQVFLTMVHLVIITGVYIGAFRMRKHAAPEFTLLMFYLLYYNHSLNIFRQYMAMAIIFAAVADIENRKHFRYLVFVGIAFLIHNSGVIGLAPLLIYRVLYPRNPNKRVSARKKWFTCILIVGGTVLFVPLVRLLINWSILSRKYLYYFNGEEANSYTLAILFIMVEAVAIAFLWKRFHRGDSMSDYFLFCSIAFLAMYIIATSINYGRRIASYFAFLNIISLGIVVKTQPTLKEKRIVRTGIILVVLVYWLYVYAFRNASQTMPYLFFAQ